MKISVGTHDVDISEKIVKAFEENVPDNLSEMAATYLRTDFEEKDLDKIFREHGIDEIKSVIERDAIGEIEVFGGTI